MADEGQQLPRVNWNEILAFTHIFKSFRMGIHVSKLLLALAAVLLIWLWGSVLDGVRGWFCDPVPNQEIRQYVRSSPVEFEKWQELAESGKYGDLATLCEGARTELNELQTYRSILQKEGGGGGQFDAALRQRVADANQANFPKPVPNADLRKAAHDNWSKAVSDFKKLVKIQTDWIEDDLIPSAEKDARKKIEELGTEDRKKAERKLPKDVQYAWRTLTLRKIDYAQQLAALEGEGVFTALKNYEGRCVSNALSAVRYGNITGGLADYRAMMDRRSRMLPEDPDTTGVPAPAAQPNETPGLLFWLLMMLDGFCWLLSEHWVMATLLLAGALAIWALFGGAIHRIAALHFGRDQKISIGQALRFSAGKFLSFYFAPLIPLGIVAVIGVLFLMLGGLLLGSWGGGILMGIFLPLAIIFGLLIAFLLIGLGGGGCLMYPTIAVESSDSFDAIGRSYSYVYGRPWRTAFYSLVGVFYGTICYVFVRFCAFLALAATHWFVGAGVAGGGTRISPMADKLDVLWPAPTFDALMSTPPTEAMSSWEAIGAWFVTLWTMLVAATVIAFAVSFCVSAKTVIYFLLRRRIDATDLDDVYVEEPHEDLGPEPVPAAPAEPAPAAPAEEKPQGE